MAKKLLYYAPAASGTSAMADLTSFIELISMSESMAFEAMSHDCFVFLASFDYYVY